ncbi:MAG: sodium:solute symporter family transporter, partial [bacterium]
LVGLFTRRYAQPTADDFFLGGRNLGPVLLFFTMAATNFSAFTIFGFSGAGYRSGYAFYPVMAFGTGFMAVSFCFLGRRIYELSKEKGYISPAELIGKHYQSRFLQILIFVVMVIFTIPYIAIQPISAGYTLESLLGIPYFWGGVLVMGIIVLYVFMGGFRGVVWTDVIQGGMMVVLMTVAMLLLAAPYGGIIKANETVFQKFPELFSRPGLNNAFPVSIWFSYMLLWLLCDPMFPQLFQRFFVARNQSSLDLTMLAYPAITGFLFLLPVTIGVIGRLSFPDLTGKETDRIIPLLLSQHANNWLGALILTAGLAALMSTLDSQLLTLSSMFTRDVFSDRRYVKKQNWLGKFFVLILAALGLCIAYRPPATILIIATETFTGLAVLFPAVLGGLYWPRATARGAILSILVGETLVVAYVFKLLPTFGFLLVVPIIVATTIVFFIVSYLDSSLSQRAAITRLEGQQRIKKINWRKAFWPLVIFSLLFFLGIDFWAWESSAPLILGFPWWIWYFIMLNILIMGAMAKWLIKSSYQRRKN